MENNPFSDVAMSLQTAVKAIQTNEEQKNSLIKTIVALTIYINIVTVIVIFLLFSVIFYMVYESYNASYPLPNIDNTLKNEVNISEQ